MILGDLATLPYRILAILVAVTVHEFAHAWTADHLGDPTPAQRGRLSLNPLVHLDVLGTLLLVLAGFGWAKPVEVNPRYFSNWRRGMLAVAVAGPLSNVAMAFVVGLWFKAGIVDVGSILGQIGLFLIVFNAVLAVFNLLPVPPLDGSRIVSNLLPPAQSLAYDRLAAYGPVVLMLLLLLPGHLLGRVIQPGVNWLIARAVGGGIL